MDEPQNDPQETAPPASVPGPVVIPENTPATVTPAAPIEAQAEVPVTTQVPQVFETSPDTMTTPPEDSSAEPQATSQDESASSITWTTAEFHDHQKSGSWYVILLVVTVAVAAILYFWTRSILTSAVVVIGGAALGIYGTHKPRQLEYFMNRQGIRIGAKQYNYNDFRLFIITPELPLPEVTLIPVKRFMPPLSIRYSPDVGSEVLDMLSEHLPSEERRPDLIDTLMHHVHF